MDRAGHTVGRTRHWKSGLRSVRRVVFTSCTGWPDSLPPSDPHQLRRRAPPTALAPAAVTTSADRLSRQRRTDVHHRRSGSMSGVRCGSTVRSELSVVPRHTCPAVSIQMASGTAAPPAKLTTVAMSTHAPAYANRHAPGRREERHAADVGPTWSVLGHAAMNDRR